MSTHIAVTDDEELIRWSLSEHLSGEGHTITECEDGVELIELLDASTPDLILLDLKMPRMGGLDVLRELRKRGSQVPVVVISALGGLDAAIEATKLGAYSYITKPFDLREVSVVVGRALEDHRLRTEVHLLRQRQHGGYGDFIGSAPSLVPVFDTLQRLEAVDAPTVLLLGDSGTGKEVVARMIHTRGPRRQGPFLEVDCAALPDNLLESELFGHEKGAFTDAHQRKIGLLEAAAGGVVFLDELGELSPGIQAKLLRALESRTFRRVGGTVQYPMDVAIIAATNRNLQAEVDAGRFRKDLFFRLNVIPVVLPPLRERRSDIPALVSHFVERFSRDFGRPIEGVSGEAMELLSSWSWPGNVREIRNVVERMVILGPGEVIEAADLPNEIRYQLSPSSSAEGCPFELPEEGIDLEAVERGLVVQAIERTDGNQSAAARLLGISRYALRYRLEKYGML